MVEKKRHMIRCYDQLYSKSTNFKEDWDGKIATAYKVPKYVQAFKACFKGKQPKAVLELGAGNGEVSELVRRVGQSYIGSYVTTEISKEGVKRLREKGFNAYQVDAQDLSRFANGSFDLVFSIDVMHHVSDPKKMAQEMLRVSRKHIFLIEANGACIVRKILEHTKKYRMAGENSYKPQKYLSFFKDSKFGNTIKYISIKPFLFSVPFTPPMLIKPMIFVSELLEKIPIIKWQGSGVVIYLEKN